MQLGAVSKSEIFHIIYYYGYHTYEGKKKRNQQRHITVGDDGRRPDDHDSIYNYYQRVQLYNTQYPMDDRQTIIFLLGTQSGSMLLQNNRQQNNRKRVEQ